MSLAFQHFHARRAQNSQLVSNNQIFEMNSAVLEWVSHAAENRGVADEISTKPHFNEVYFNLKIVSTSLVTEQNTRFEFHKKRKVLCCCHKYS